MNLYLNNDIYNFKGIALIYPNKNEDLYKLFNINVSFGSRSEETIQEVTKCFIERVNSIEDVNEKFVIDSILDVDFTRANKICVGALIDDFISKSRFKKYKGLLKWVPMLQDRFWLNEPEEPQKSERRSKKPGDHLRRLTDAVIGIDQYIKNDQSMKRPGKVKFNVSTPKKVTPSATVTSTVGLLSNIASYTDASTQSLGSLTASDLGKFFNESELSSASKYMAEGQKMWYYTKAVTPKSTDDNLLPYE